MKTSTQLLELPQSFSNTREFIDLIQLKYDNHKINNRPKSIYNFIFLNRGWQLTLKGSSFLSEYFTTYKSTYEGNNLVTGYLLLRMNKLIEGPWALDNNTVILWNSSIHFELQLVGGKLSDLLDFKV